MQGPQADKAAAGVAKAAKAGTAASKVANAAHVAGAAASKAAGAMGSTKAFAAGGYLLAFAGRRALWPAMALGSAFGAAGWFGVFDSTISLSKVIMPPPSKPDAHARRAGWATVPVSLVSAGLVGWRFAPALAPPPSSIADIGGFMGFMASLPLGHLAKVGTVSAVVAGITCRVVQYRGGA